MRGSNSHGNTRDQLVREDKDFLNNVNVALESQLRAADFLMSWDRPELAERLESVVKSTLRRKHKADIHLQALEYITEDAQLDSNNSDDEEDAAGDQSTTDFGEKLNQKVAQLQSARFDVEETDEFASYKHCIAKPPDVGSSGAHLADDEDDGIEMVDDSGGAALNTHCPLSGKSLEALQLPVIDRVGYVYEREAIRRLIRDNGVSVECPVAGTCHVVTLQELKPVYALVRKLKRKRDQARRTQEAI